MSIKKRKPIAKKLIPVTIHRLDELKSYGYADAYPHSGYAYVGKKKTRVQLGEDLCREIIHLRSKL